MTTASKVSAAGMQDVIDLLKVRRRIAAGVCASFVAGGRHKAMAKAYQAEVAALDKLLAHYAALGYD